MAIMRQLEDGDDKGAGDAIMRQLGDDEGANDGDDEAAGEMQLTIAMMRRWAMAVMS